MSTESIVGTRSLRQFLAREALEKETSIGPSPDQKTGIKITTKITTEEGEKVTTTTWVSSKVFHVKKTITCVTREIGTPRPPTPGGSEPPPPPASPSTSSDSPGSPRGSQEASDDVDSGDYPDIMSERSRPNDSSSFLETTSSEGEISRGPMPRQDESHPKYIRLMTGLGTVAENGADFASMGEKKAEKHHLPEKCRSLEMVNDEEKNVMSI